jgi:hypothetical protein
MLGVRHVLLGDDVVGGAGAFNFIRVARRAYEQEMVAAAVADDSLGDHSDLASDSLRLHVRGKDETYEPG